MTPPLSERDFQRQVTELAELCGWEWMHPRAGRTVDSWRTPMSGTMAQGWPDLVLIHEKQRRLIFAEVKTDAGRLTEAQQRVIGVIDELTDRSSPFDAPKIELYVWRPKFWSFIQETLSERRAA